MRRFELFRITPILTVSFFIMIQHVFSQHALIPVPVEYTPTEEPFELKSPVRLILQSSNMDVIGHIQRFSTELKEKGYEASMLIGPDLEVDRGISFHLNQSPDKGIGIEGYTLHVKQEGIEVTANHPSGFLYAIQTLRQLIPVEFKSQEFTMGKPLSIPGCKIVDYPRFGWRGLMLDVSRHFFTVDEVKAYLDAMVEYKMNTFHWHLTDDNGWRIEIKALPKLTEVGAWRVERHGRFGNRRDPAPDEPTPYGGFYTHEQIRDVVAYATARNITIVPEIDVPGHSMAALAAYPELSTRKEPKQVNPGTAFAEWYGGGKFKMLVENTLNPADEKVYAFLEKVFAEVADLFPGPFIHVGGDEAYHGYWEEDPGCQALMDKKGLKDGHELQSYFMKRVEKIISSNGKKMIGWDEILEGGLADGAAVMSWRGMEGGIEAAKMGHEVVMSPTTYCYLDYTQGDHSLEIPIYADLSLKKSYSFEPVPDGVDPKYILGGQGNLWTEQIPTVDHAFYMTYPRAMAIAETVWSPKDKKDWVDFTRRLETHFTRFDLMGRNISKAIYDPMIQAYMEDGELKVKVNSDLEGVTFHYTTDHTFPNERTPKYTGPVTVPEGQNVAFKVVAYRNGERIGRMISLHRDELLKRAGNQ